MKDNIIIINAFPNNLKKITLLAEQISYLKKMNIPILVVSGCNVPEFIQKEIDYLIINTENEHIGKDFSFYCISNGLNDTSFHFITSHFFHADLYTTNVNCTIAKNIKLGFNLAKALGYKTASYTEDDNIWKDGSFNYVNNLLNAINNDKYRISGVLGKMASRNSDIIFTTFFASDIEYFLNKFIIPHNKIDWYNLENIKKFRLNYPFEDVLYNLIQDDMDVFYQTHDVFINELLENNPVNQSNFSWGIYKRDYETSYIVKNNFVILPSNDNRKILFLYHNGATDNLYNIDILFENGSTVKQTLNKHEYYVCDLGDDNWVELTNENETVRLSTNYDEIKYNGKIEFF